MVTIIHIILSIPYDIQKKESAYINFIGSFRLYFSGVQTQVSFVDGFDRRLLRLSIYNAFINLALHEMN